MRESKQKTSKLARQQRLKAAARKKAIIAGCLLVVMGLLWIRVLAKKHGGSVPAKAAASVVNTSGQTAPAEKKLKGTALKHKEIEIVQGRNDVLVRDVFSQKSWMGKGYESITSETDNWANQKKILKNDIVAASQLLKLEAIIMGQGGKLSEVFINGCLVPAGSDFPIRHNGRIFRFTVVDVGPEKVLVKCLDVEVTLKISQKG